MLETISDFLRAIASIIPRIVIVTKQEQGIKFLPRGRTKKLLPQTKWYWPLHWYWPIVSKVEVIPVVRQPLDLPVQTLMTKDGKSVIVGGIVFYSIVNIEKYLVENYDSIVGIQDTGAAALRDVIVNKTLDEIQNNNRRSIDNAMTKAANEVFEAFGIEVEVIRLKDFSTARILNLVTSRAGNDSPKETISY